MEEQRIDITHFPDFACPKCGSKLMREAVIVKQIPKFVIGNDKPAYAPAPVIVCLECKNIMFTVSSPTMLIQPYKPFILN